MKLPGLPWFFYRVRLLLAQAKGILRNVHGRTGLSRRALLSYITVPFTRPVGFIRHTNHYEALAWADLLDRLGYVVDVIPATRHTERLDYGSYDLICGFGEPMEQSFRHHRHEKIKRIVYATGCYPHFSNHQTLARVLSYFEETGVWAPNCGRLLDRYWSMQFMLSDLLVVLGNRHTLDTFSPWRLRGEADCLDGFYLPGISAPAPFQPWTESRRRSFLWFGSSGCIHKGLNLVLGAMREVPNAELHICGLDPSEAREARLESCYADVWSRVRTHGFLPVGSEELREVFSQCGTVVHPSASEGGAPSVLTAVVHGSLIPLVTKNAGLDLMPGIQVYLESTANGVAREMQGIIDRPLSELEAQAEAFTDHYRRRYTYDNYIRALEGIVRRHLS